jgi:hypothetical protein
MKNFKSLLFSCLLVITLVSCKKGDDAKVTEGSMSAKVDGKEWTAGLAVQATKTSGVMAIGGTGNGAQININVLSYSGPKTYPIGGTVTSTTTTQAIFTKTELPPTVYNTMVGQGAGTLTISSEDGGYVEGTFSFTAKTTTGANVTITDGKFRSKLM